MGHISFVGILSVTQIIILAIRISHYVTLFTNRGSTVDQKSLRYVLHLFGMEFVPALGSRISSERHEME